MNTKKYSKIKIYFTSYGPFQDVKVNPTEKVVSSFMSNKAKFETNYTKLVYSEVFQVTTDYVDKHIPEFYQKIDLENTSKDELILIIHYGLASRRKEICIESQAKNSIRDEFKCCKIEENEITKYVTKLCVDNLAKNCTCDQAKCQVSNDAGTYLCNYIYYNSLKRYDGVDNVLCTFIHIPELENIDIEGHQNFLMKFIKCLEDNYITK